jgi:hypothetical protein
MNEDDEVHPLDRDYSVPTQTDAEADLTYNPQLRKTGTITFVVGLIVMFLAAIVISNFVGNRSVEFFASMAHRLGMVLGLIGGMLVVAAYRWQQLKGLLQGAHGKRLAVGSSPLAVLCGANVLGFACIAVIGYALTGIRTPMVYYVVFNGLTSILCALMVTLAIWHRGFIQAYAIGVLVPLLLNIFSGLFSFDGGYWVSDGRSLVLINLAIYLVCGLVCGAYVFLLNPGGIGEEQ